MHKSSVVSHWALDLVPSLTTRYLYPPYRPHKNGKNFTSTTVLCDTGASVSLALVSITEKLGIFYNSRETISMRGVNGASIKVLETAYIFVRDIASPSGKKIRLVIIASRETFFFSNTDLKNLSVLAANFPSYLGAMPQEVLASAP